MHKTLLLCFIHGFKGGDDTFASFPEHLRALCSHALPNVTVRTTIYPKFETRGDLSECVSRFQEWLQNKIIDIEVAAGTPSPTVDPSVHTILIGHSMGGIVAAETLLSITSDLPIPPPCDPKNLSDTMPSTAAHTEHIPFRSSGLHNSNSSLMFPYIAGILAFDTPYLGIAPSLVAHGAEEHYKTASSAYTGLSDLAGTFGYGSSKKPTSDHSQQSSQKMLTETADVMSASMDASSDSPSPRGKGAWQKWGKYAMFAGAAGALAAGGATAYLKKEKITESWSFIGSHLEFVGCLAKGEELKTRLERIIRLNKEKGVGFADLVTVLGRGAPGQKTNGKDPVGKDSSSEAWVLEATTTSDRTFCTLPKNEEIRRFFEKARNDKAANETLAHMGMFTAKDNNGYFSLGERSRDLIREWIAPETNPWYKESEPAGGRKTAIDIELETGEPNTWAKEG